VIPKNKLTVIIGPIGSSKSSFLMALLGEMTLLKGSAQVEGSKSFASQKPWIFAGSVKENIVFFREFNKERYEKVIYACELARDIELLPNRDETIIGERGVNLSGGQKARVALARACYANSDFYLFDDPLSAVDALVGSRIMKNCLSSEDDGLLSRTTRILVTHQTQFISSADYLICMDQGAIKYQGSSDFYDSESSLNAGSAMDSKKKRISPNEEENFSKKFTKSDDDFEKRNSKSVIEVEDRVIGKVGHKVYANLIASVGSKSTVIVFIFIAVSAQVALVLSDFWLSKWSSEPINEQRDFFFISLYFVFGVLCFFFSTSRTHVFFRMILHASAILHNGMFKGVLYSPLRFFEANPVGRILNRFAKDQSTVDENLPISLWYVIELALMVLSVLLVVGILNPISLVSLIVIIPAFVYTRSRYVASSREIKRLEGITKSPILAFFSSALDGLTIIRSFHMQNHFKNLFFERLDHNNRAWYTFLYLGRWIGFRLDFISSLMILTATIGAVGLKNSIDSGLIAFALLYVLKLTSLVQRTVRLSAEAENHMTSLERIYTYSQLPEEGRRILEKNRPLIDWPSKGEILISDLKLRYRPDLDFVLKRLKLAHLCWRKDRSVWKNWCWKI
jgi:ATP-binding cassette subfamily C (CFTR/MRP) protein 4